MEHPDRLWQIYVDTGGTFTDCIAVGPDGAVKLLKVLSSGAVRTRVARVHGPRKIRLESLPSPDAGLLRGWRLGALGRSWAVRIADADGPDSTLTLDGDAAIEPGLAVELSSGEEAPVVAARIATGTRLGDPLPPLMMRLATTRATNALLQRTGSPTALFTTRGFRDLLEIGTQQRPELFTLRIVKPTLLHVRTVEVDERLAADGSVLRPLDLGRVLEEAGAVLRSGIRTAAVALLHAWKNPEHERQVAGALRELGFEHVSCSAELSPLARMLPRTETAVVNAYLAPVLESYLAAVRAAAGDERQGRVAVMTSSGGLVPAARFRAKDSLLSGPAGGVVGAAAAAKDAGFDRVITFDMGGTSTDVARYDGAPEYVFEHTVGGAHVLAPAVAVESVAAGGGSVCRLGPEGLCVGPQSAGAWPGPACYGAGGPLTITDVNVLLGRLDPQRFGLPLDAAAAEGRLNELLEELERREGRRSAREDLLEGLADLADERMADAIRTVSVRRGYDPAGYALVAFGGAGGQHACGVAERLGMRTVLVPPLAGLLSAEGLRRTGPEQIMERQVLLPLESVAAELGGIVAELANAAMERLESTAGNGSVERRVLVSLRFQGQDFAVAVEWDGRRDLDGEFRARYLDVYGHVPAGRRIEVEAVRVVLRRYGEVVAIGGGPGAASRPEPAAVSRTRLRGEAVRTPVYERERIGAGASVDGPAIIVEAHGATLIRPGWRATVAPTGALVVHALQGAAAPAAAPAVRAEIFANRLREIAREMGEMLRRTSLSTNVKERLDFSCGVLDQNGQLVVNAPHIPVHLGALGLCVRAVLRAVRMEAGDVIVTNHPAFGGSHLPDITVITPVFADGGALLGYVASRAHHAEIGGSRPGSMPPNAKTLVEEGVVLPPIHLFKSGRANWEGLRRRLTGAPYPTRNVEENLADISAAVAANRHGERELRRLAASEGHGAIAAAMRRLGDLSWRSISDAIRTLGAIDHGAEEALDDGTILRVAVAARGEAMTLDFGGSAPVHPGNLNATPAIVRSAVMYVLRLLAGGDLPLNEGMMRTVSVLTPPGILNPPFDDDPACCPAVAGGNTETSQRLVDLLLKAFGLAACSQGTMNNVLFGNDRFGYYETICGGEGACDGHHGASAVHTHMTNTRITDPEILEQRYPVRLERFEVRTGSGGGGRWRGGDGVVREITFLERVSLSVLAQHRSAGPYGLRGGTSGAPGAQRIVTGSGAVQILDGTAAAEVSPGDRFVIETPGGGGFGSPA